MARPDVTDLLSRLCALDLSVDTFWLSYACCGGHASSFELDAILHDALQPQRHELVVIDQALWELENGLGPA
jgi:hypothetical protein